MRVRAFISEDRVKISSYPSWLTSSIATWVSGPVVIGTSSITSVAGVKVSARMLPELNGIITSKKPSESQSVSSIEYGKIPFKPSIFLRTRCPESKTPPML